MTRTLIPTDAPCPTWCQEGHGHPYEPDGPDAVIRGHSGTLRKDDALGVDVGIYALEARDKDGTVTAYTPTVHLLVSGHEDEQTPGTLRKIAAAILNAADAAEFALTET